MSRFYSQEVQTGSARAPLINDPKERGIEEEESKTWMVKPSASRRTMGRIGKRAGKASMMRIGKKTLEMLPIEDPSLSPATLFSRDERGGKIGGRSWKINQMWLNHPKLSRYVRFVREERGGIGEIGERISRRLSKGRSAFFRLGKRFDNNTSSNVEEEPRVERISQKRDPEKTLKRDYDQVDFGSGGNFGSGGRSRCLEEKMCNVVFNRNGMTYRIFYRNN